MMTREQIKEIVDYSQEHGITIKQRLQELNIPESNFYYAKRMYNREDMVPGVDGCFIQLSNDNFKEFEYSAASGEFSASLGVGETIKDGGVAYYPSTIAINGTPGSVSLPATYTAADAAKGFPMMASVDLGATTLSFTHLGGLLTLTASYVPADATKLVLTVPSVGVTGSFAVSTDHISASASASTVTLTFAAGAYGTSSTEFFIPVPVTTFSAGFTMEFKNASNETLFTKSTSKTTIAVARAAMKRMTSFTVPCYLYVSYDGAWDNFEGNSTTTYAYVYSSSNGSDVLTAWPGDAIDMSGTIYTHNSESYIRLKDISSFQKSSNCVFHINWDNNAGGNPYKDCLRAVINSVSLAGDVYIKVAVPSSPSEYKVFIRNWSNDGYINRVYVWNSATDAAIVNAWPGADFRNVSYAYKETLNETVYTYVPVAANTNIGMKGVYETDGNTDNQLGNKFYNDSSEGYKGKYNILYTMKGSNSDDQSWYWKFPNVEVSVE